MRLSILYTLSDDDDDDDSGDGDIAVVDCIDDDETQTTPAAFLRRIETPCAYTAMRCEFMTNNGEK